MSTKATIHDLGYKRYLGSRKAQSTRWLAIVKNVIFTSWKGWWRYRVWLGSAFLITAGVTLAMYLSGHQMFDQALVGGIVRSYADTLPAISITWYGNAAFIATLAAITPILPKDLRAGAFQFYFSRPVRPFDYLLGKIAGAFLLMVPFLLLGPLFLAFARIALSNSGVVDTLHWIPKAFFVGVVATWMYAVLPLAFGALFSNPKSAGGLWALFTLLVTGVSEAISRATNIDALVAISPFSAVRGFTFNIYDLSFSHAGNLAPMWACIVSLVLYSVVAVVMLHWRVRSSYRQGVGS